MDFKEQLKNASGTPEDILSKENQIRRRDAVDYAAALHRIIKEELLRVISKGNYTEINGTKYAVLYVSSKETLIRRYVRNSYVDYDHMNTFQVEITSHKTYRKSFFRYTPVIWQTCTITPDKYKDWDCLLEQLTTLCRMDSIDVKPIIFDTRNQMEYPASFPWERSEEMLMDYYFIVCLKCTAEC